MSRPSRLVLSVLALAAAALPGGCTAPASTQPATYRTIAQDPRRNSELAASLDRQGVEMLVHNQLPQAEAKFRDALVADMFYGPAHNNLGTVYYKQDKLYLAAWEYQYAAKLMPGKAAPVNNQGMVQERVGKIEDAVKLYEQAAKLDGESAQVAANLARAYIRMGRRDEATAEVLRKVAARDSRPEWLSWAQRELATIGMRADRTTTAPAPTPPPTTTAPTTAPAAAPTTRPARPWIMTAVPRTAPTTAPAALPTK